MDPNQFTNSNTQTPFQQTPTNTMTLSHTNFSGQMDALHPSIYPSSPGIPVERSLEADVRIVTSGGLRIPVHSSVLASASTVFENMIDQPCNHHNSNKKRIRILGVSNEAVVAFVGFLNSLRCSEEEMDKYGIHLLTLSHVYSIRELKQRCTRGLAVRLTVENVIDILQLARLCDAPDLHVKCMKVVSSDFKLVEKTEGWKFLQEHDPWLELEILGFMDEDDERRKEMRKKRKEQNLYLQLSEAMDCLEHICTDGCTSVGPSDKEPSKNKESCCHFSTCQGLQLLFRHFATCTKRVNGGCSRCTRMWQLLKLHSSICDQPDHCRVPLCRQFRLKMEKGHNSARWKLLVKKVVSTKIASSLFSPNTTKINHSNSSHN